MDYYSADSFEHEYKDRIVSGPDYLNGDDGCFFLERDGLRNVKFDRLIIFRFMRRYPATEKLDIPMDNLRPAGRTIFRGYSHNAIAEETYVRVTG